MKKTLNLKKRKISNSGEMEIKSNWNELANKKLRKWKKVTGDISSDNHSDNEERERLDSSLLERVNEISDYSI